MRMIFPLAIVALFAGFSSAATGASCSVVSAKSCAKSATAFCSSYLHIPVKTVTTTITKAVTSTRTTTITTGTTVATVISGTTTQLTTDTETHYSNTYTTTSITDVNTVYITTHSYYGGCNFNMTTSVVQKRAEATSTQPACLSSYPSGTALSSACQCFSIPTSTSTVAKASTKTSVSTKTATAPKATRTTRVRKTITSTKTTTSTETDLYTSTVQPQTTQYVASSGNSLWLANGPSGLLADFEEVSSGVGAQFVESYGPHADTWTLASWEGVNCVLAGFSGRYGYIPSGDIILFDDNPPAEQLVPCLQEINSQQIYCRNPKGSSYNGGFVDSDSFLHFPVDPSQATAEIIGYSG